MAEAEVWLGIKLQTGVEIDSPLLLSLSELSEFNSLEAVCMHALRLSALAPERQVVVVTK